MEALSLLELNALVRRSLEQCLPDEYWVQAELSDVRTNSTGHCYLEFIHNNLQEQQKIAGMSFDEMLEKFRGKEKE